MQPIFNNWSGGMEREELDPQKTVVAEDHLEGGLSPSLVVSRYLSALS